MPGAAFFDLDRTLLPGASGPAFSAALREVGVLPPGGVPGEGLLFGLFDLVGETRPSMVLARQGVRLSQGWDAEKVAEAGRIAAGRLVTRVQPYARQEMAMHRREGRPTVVATTSPDELVRPLAAALGFDDVVATRYARTDGTLDGAVDGHYVWGKGKLAAVGDWADAHGCDLAASWAYSDSYYDVPLLSAVGHPVAVNPDARLALVATTRRWTIRYLDAPDGVPKPAGLEPQRALVPVLRPEAFPYARFDINGVGRIPDGPAILAANHRSYFDFVALALTVVRRGRTARFLGKRELFSTPVVGPVFAALGGIPVDRGTGSDAPLRAAADALEAGELVVILPQGTIPRGPAFFDAALRGRSGVARLAAMSGAPVVPVGLWGTERVWPRSARLPNVLNVVRPPRVQVWVGEPRTLSADVDPAAGTAALMDAIVDLLPAEARTTRTPEPAELARTYPGGRAPEPAGTDGG